jgi:hypothetical protein
LTVPLSALTPAGPSNESAIIMVASVRNAGSQSMADCCTLKVFMPDSKDAIDTQRIAFPPSFTVKNSDNTQILAVYNSADALYDKLGTKPILTGEMVRGVMMFGIPNVPPEMLSRPGVLYRLSLSDVDGTVYTADNIFGGVVDNTTAYLAGLSSSQSGGICLTPPTATPSPSIFAPSSNGP